MNIYIWYISAKIFHQWQILRPGVTVETTERRKQNARRKCGIAFYDMVFSRWFLYPIQSNLFVSDT